ncbi:MAG: SPOR domain-containing protein [Bacteroidales bacterium]|nr:SPOR domain-containing protein [Bacteroidales bacterium]
MNINQYISELLFDHDCVILPGLGGFVTNYSPANIHPVLHRFSPPAKDILFNTSLKNSDGLLVNYLSQKQNISFENANHIVHQFVDNCLSQLNNRQNISLPGIGTLWLNVEKKIQFTPEKKLNYLNSSYGLTSFVSPPVKKETDLQFKKRELFKDRVPVTERHSSVRKPKYAALYIIPVLILFVWGYLNMGVIKDFSTNYSGIFTYFKAFQTDVSTFPSTNNVQPETIEIKDISLAPSATANTEDEKEDSEAETKKIFDSPIPVMNDHQIETSPKTTIDETSFNYFIIAGAFKNLNNASSLVEKLTAKGYDARIVGVSSGGLHRVSYNGYTRRDDALENMRLIRSNENPEAWVLKR